ncbi:MAG: carboxymuconolactone decarboxylase family protein [Thermodesulfobacteriota bacterium]
MIKRISYIKTAPEAIKAFSAGADYLESSSIEPRLRYLVELRVSQINGCAYCVDLHTNQLRREGETQQRLDCLVVWREVPFYDERERAALDWAEAVTLIKDTHAPDSAYEAVSAHFTEKELVDLTFVIANMNLWNRVAISFRRLPGKRG